VDAKEKNLYWRGWFAYFRKRIGKKDHWESMGELPLDAGAVLVKTKCEAAAKQVYLARWNLLKMRSDFSTVDETCSPHMTNTRPALILRRLCHLIHHLKHEYDADEAIAI
jgi:hypothetical protein